MKKENAKKRVRGALVACAAALLAMLSLPAWTQTRRALVIGLGQQQDRNWNKINGDRDVPFVVEMLKGAGFRSIATLVNQNATKAGIVGAFRNMAASCRQGDIVYVHYSGHGQQMRDVHDDEADWLDECWIPYDACRYACASDRGEKHLTDDEVNYWLNAIRDKVGGSGKMLVVIDACHSGDGTRNDDGDVVRGVEDVFETVRSAELPGGGERTAANVRARPLPERWTTLSACRSDQVNSEMKRPVAGKLTYALYKMVAEHPADGNGEFMQRVRMFFLANAGSQPQNPVMTGDGRYRCNITDILRRR